MAWSAHRSVEFPLRRDAPCTGEVGTDIDGLAPLHHAALSPSLDMARALLDTHLTGLDPEIMDKGFKAVDCLSRAEGLLQGFAPASRQLLSDVQARPEVRGSGTGSVNILVIKVDGPEDGDNYFDALGWPESLVAGDS
ncbi:hypothetical protein FGG08_003910 [Glutinoglossum americanum]|uniref:Uncharacterized protein n=1 Tax=Glutinoglossum americanum TaxID=1670608 RepID=A0A9P8I8L8_9PEZI|nr:hypothetical protein FGG08_003910 [Glutinoglossum americanum]